MRIKVKAELEDLFIHQVEMGNQFLVVLLVNYEPNLLFYEVKQIFELYPINLIHHVITHSLQYATLLPKEVHPVL